MKNRELLYELLKTPSPSGYELNIQKKVIELMKPYADQVITHHNYNVINVVNPESKVKVLLCGHIDEVGLCINAINIAQIYPSHLTGLYSFPIAPKYSCIEMTATTANIGAVRPYVYIGQHVKVIKQNGNYVSGVIGYLPNLSKGGLELSDLILDLGTNSKEETQKLIKYAFDNY